ncbi:aminopeptidase P family protein [Lentibacillus cibarius]|uniref:Aminopeptidase P family protein n=1 Tax=Lentibacillus cibarius TaxID=2583219 RepID=A0A549YM47_9BACI|nr:Xaa-Pro peptidase family protein [Lentibacillus cibarius]TMN21169.1 aminopeptidase P family protein [Lentibacillus cibarius]TRM12949.1 aminopeptidase P family protein [Lentibacillus cibarius]
MTDRLDTLLKELKEHDLESMLVTSAANFYYLSNYYTNPHERLIAVYISLHHDPLLILPAMEQEDAKHAGWKYEMIAYSDGEDPLKLFHQYLIRNDSIPQSIAVERNHLTMERFAQVQTVLPQASVSDAQDILAHLRVIKSSQEYALLREAAALADFGVETGVKAIKEGVSELEIIAKIEYEMKKQGVQQMSFSTMALSGTKTASPHGTPSLKTIENGDLVLFDLGVVYGGYCSDTTRTVAYKSITPEQQKIYQTVLEAETKAIDASIIGTAVGDIDLAARSHIEQAEYGNYFTHRIGHGLGIETHEYPSMHSRNKLPLAPGMCYTIEPGIYVPGKGGVRIEDMIFMTDEGAETLTKFPKDLQIVE